MGTVKASPIVSHFFIFNPTFGRKEGEEHKKLLFYFPKDESLDTKVQNIGFCEAVVKFTETFSSSTSPTASAENQAAPPGSYNFLGRAAGNQTNSFPFHHVSTEKQLHVYCWLEEDFLMGIAINRKRAAEQKYVLYPPAIYQITLTAYEMFRLFFGTFERVLRKEGGVEALINRLDYFFVRYLATMKLYTMPLLDCFNGVQFLTLDSINFLKVETLISEILEVFPQISHTLFLYQDQLLWYTVPRDSVPILYKYLTQNLLPMSLRAELQPEVQKRTMSSMHHHGKFVTGPTEGLNQTAIYQSMTASSPTEKRGSESGLKLPVVFLKKTASGEEQGESGVSASSGTGRMGSEGPQSDRNEMEAFNLVVYRALNASLAMLVRVEQVLDMDYYRNLDSLLGAQLTALASAIGEVYAKQAPSNVGVDQHFVFYNPLSMSVRSTFLETVPEGSKLPNNLPTEIVSLVCELRDEAQKSDYFGDVLAKSDSEWWVVGKKANSRELYLVMAQKHANLTEIHEEVKKICNTHFENLFLTE